MNRTHRNECKLHVYGTQAIRINLKSCPHWRLYIVADFSDHRRSRRKQSPNCLQWRRRLVAVFSAKFGDYSLRI